MAQILGDNVLPESVQSRRRTLRSKVQDLREPIRQKRQGLVPGPDVIGKAESKLGQVRNKFISREGVMARIKERRSDSTDSKNNSSGGSEDSKSSDRPTMT